jgi:hypothetical protein
MMTNGRFDSTSAALLISRGVLHGRLHHRVGVDEIWIMVETEVNTEPATFMRVQILP